MTSNGQSRRSRLSITLEPELQQKIESAAAESELIVHDYVVAVLRDALDAAGQPAAPRDDATWARLSAQSFARDWDSEEDRIYDGLP